MERQRSLAGGGERNVTSRRPVVAPALRIVPIACQPSSQVAPVCVSVVFSCLRLVHGLATDMRKDGVMRRSAPRRRLFSLKCPKPWTARHPPTAANGLSQHLSCALLLYAVGSAAQRLSISRGRFCLNEWQCLALLNAAAASVMYGRRCMESVNTCPRRTRLRLRAFTLAQLRSGHVAGMSRNC